MLSGRSDSYGVMSQGVICVPLKGSQWVEVTQVLAQIKDFD